MMILLRRVSGDCFSLFVFCLGRRFDGGLMAYLEKRG